MAEVATAFPANYFVFLDESGGDKRTQYRRMGYSIRGMRATEARLLHRGGRWTAFVALSCTGIVGVDIIQESGKSENFFDFLGSEVVPRTYRDLSRSTFNSDIGQLEWTSCSRVRCFGGECWSSLYAPASLLP